ncbi:MAG TPA: ABC transporter permease [Mycobacteriales bacterium]|jgi:lipooligosaccharide transport system permease protein|nr:ABC transporter permease [Mycobacteriales bacterium]
MIAAPFALRSFEYWLFQYKRTWRGTVTSSVLFPVLFLASMGVGLGTLVDSSTSRGVEGHSYLVFLAPGLLAATAMQTGVSESTYPVMGSIKWVKTYHAMLATPLGVLDVLVGHLLYIGARIAMGAVVFLVVMAAFGAVDSPLGLLAIPAALLTGLAFAAPTVAFAAWIENENSFAFLMRFIVMPLFLFGGVFYPVGQLPLVLEQLAYLTPLWHGVALSRDLSLGTASAAGTFLHVVYLLAWITAGFAVAARNYRRRLAV